jgi:two-component system chemotaxis sensor kinase CheA
VVLILDPNGVCRSLGLEQSRESHAASVENLPTAPSDKTRLVHFRAGSGVDKVLPLSSIARIETVNAARIEYSSGMMLMRHQGRLMPIVAAAPDVTVREGDNTVFVISPHGEPFGLLVDSIVDIVEHRLDVEIGGEAPGVIGAADIGGKVVELVDIAYFIDLLQMPQERPRDRKSRLLLVDDAAFFRDMLSSTLQAAGFDVVKAGTAAQALGHVAQDPHFDAILIDVDLPDGSGFQLAARLREAGARAEMIALAPYATRDVSRNADAAGMAGAVGKFQRNQMLDLIRACIERGREGTPEESFRGVAA